jgi:hypothetical protein
VYKLFNRCFILIGFYMQQVILVSILYGCSNLTLYGNEKKKLLYLLANCRTIWCCPYRHSGAGKHYTACSFGWWLMAGAGLF